jgi:hypothetical protein
VLLVRHLGEIGGARAVFPAQAEALDDAGEAQQDRRRDADGLIGGERGDHQRAEAHQHHGQHQRVAAAVRVREVAEQPAADGAHDEADGEQDSGVELLHDGVVAREERAREIQREGRVGIEIVPLDQVADRADEDGLHPALDVGDVQVVVSGGCSHLQASENR